MSSFNFNKLTNKELRLLTEGGVGVLPTDTVYGLVTQASNPESIKRLYSIKSRHRKPGTIIASDIGQLINLGIAEADIIEVARFWPGPVSIVLSTPDNLEYLHQGVGSLAFRVVADSELIKLLDITGPLMTSSANDPDQPTANNLIEARHYFGDKVDFYIDGGDLTGKAASTLIKIDDGKVIILRNGEWSPDTEN